MLLATVANTVRFGPELRPSKKNGDEPLLCPSTWLIVTGPYPAESSTQISPPGSVLISAPAKLREGAVRLGLESDPLPDRNVRCEAACAAPAVSKTASAPIATVNGLAWPIAFLPRCWRPAEGLPLGFLNRVRQSAKLCRPYGFLFDGSSRY